MTLVEVWSMFNYCSWYSLSVALSNWQFGLHYLSIVGDGPVSRTEEFRLHICENVEEHENTDNTTSCRGKMANRYCGTGIFLLASNSVVFRK